MTARLGAKKRRVLKDALVERDGFLCVYCCRPIIDMPIFPNERCGHHMTIEHLLPVSLGGTDDLWNLALACFDCNNQRGSDINWTAVEFDHGQALLDQPHRGESCG